jgi:hypothetical protein
MASKSNYVPRVRARRNSARRLSDTLPEALQRRLADAGGLIAAPLVGVTTDGNAIAGLFPLQDSGLSLADVSAAAAAFLAALDGTQRDEATFPLETDAWRSWSNVHPFLMRHGQLIEALTDAGRQAALDLVRTTLSPSGFETARNIMRLNETIREITGSDEEYGEWLYWMSLMGEPSDDEPWGWQIDGHHLIINAFLLNGQLVATPTFMGTEPVTADAGKYEGITVFREEESRGYALMTSLSSAQRSLALLDEDLPGEVLTTAFRDNFELRYEGIPYRDLSSVQQQALLDLVEIYVGRMRADQAALKMDEIDAHLEETYFAWMGRVDDASPFYYRVQSPVILIEFDHQRGVALDNAEASRAHIHTIVRTPNGNDYGADLLRQHYERHPHS